MKTTKRLIFAVIAIATLVVHPFLSVVLSPSAYADTTASMPASIIIHTTQPSAGPGVSTAMDVTVLDAGSQPVAIGVSGYKLNIHSSSATGVFTRSSVSSPVISDATFNSNWSVFNFSYADTTPGEYTLSAQLEKVNAPAFIASTPFSVTSPSQLNGDYFSTFDGGTNKGMNVGFDVHDFGIVSSVTVDLYQNDRKIVTNTGTQALLTALSTGQTQIETTFYTQGGVADTNWDNGAYTWSFGDQPTGAVVTVMGTLGTKTVIIAPLVEANGVTFKNLILDQTAPNAPTGGTPDGGTLTTKSVDMAWIGSTDDSGDSPIYTVQYSQDPAFSDAISISTGATTVHVDTVTDGVWYWRVNAIDGAGNSSAWSSSYSFNIDTTGPTVTTNLADDEILSGVRTVRTTTDASEWQLDIYLAGDLNDSLLASKTDDTVIDTTKLINGKYIAVWTSTDDVGNMATFSVSFQISNILVVGGVTTGTLPSVALAPLFFTPDLTASPAIATFGPSATVGNTGSKQAVTPSIRTPQVTDMDENDTKSTGLQASQSGWRLFGVNWYWWLLALGAVGIMVRQTLLRQK